MPKTLMRNALSRGFLACVIGVAGACATLAGAPAMASAQDAATAAQQSVEQEIPEPIRMDIGYKLKEGQPIEVDNPYGSVYMRFGGYEHQFDLHITLQQPEGAAKFALEPQSRDGRFAISPRLPDGVALAEGQRIDLVLYVPKGHAAKIRTTTGMIESRGLKSDIDMASESGEIAVRGTDGTVQAQTLDGKIEVTLEDGARAGSIQRLASRTGEVIVHVSDKLNVEARMSTSEMIATDYSLTIEHLDGQEPNKRAVALVGVPGQGKDKAVLELESLGGEVRLHRKGVFVDPE
jgi:hypothetical protein